MEMALVSAWIYDSVSVRSCVYDVSVGDFFKLLNAISLYLVVNALCANPKHLRRFRFMSGG